MFVNFDSTYVKLKNNFENIRNFKEILRNLKKFIMKCCLFQEKLHKIFHNNKGNNENTNEYI